MKPEPPPDSERDRFQSLLPDLQDGGRWTIKNDGNGWAFRRVWDVRRPDQSKTTKSTRYGSLLWCTWELMKARYDDDQIRGILAAKVAARQRELRAA